MTQDYFVARLVIGTVTRTEATFVVIGVAPFPIGNSRPWEVSSNGLDVFVINYDSMLRLSKRGFQM